MLMLTTIYDILRRCCAKTITIVPVFIMVRIEYSGGGTADGEKTKNSLFTLNLYM